MTDVVETNVDQATDNLEQELSSEKTFTQNDLTRVGSKEHSKGYAKALKELGFSDAETAKSELEAYKQWQEQQKTEQEKQSEALEAKEKELANASAQLKSLQAENAALKQGVIAESVDDVVALAERLVDDETTIDDAIKSVLEKYPQFKGTEPPSTQSVAPGNRYSTKEAEVNVFEQKLAKYRK